MGKLGEKIIILAFFALLLSISLASARLTISEPQAIYNFGDKMYIAVVVNPSSVSGNFEINLVCKNAAANLYRVPAEPSFAPNVEQTVSTFITLIPGQINNASGQCLITASLGSEAVSTKEITITDIVQISAELAQVRYNPGETIKLTLTATKANGQPLSGFLETSGATAISRAVENGIVVESFAMPKSTAAGLYSLNVNVYDRWQDNVILNHGEYTLSFSINQIPTTLQLSLNSFEAQPGENFEFGADIYDQTKQPMPGTATATLISPDGKEITLSVESGSKGKVYLPADAAPGTWFLSTEFGSTSDNKEFSVPAVQKVDISFLDTVLVVKNVGNCPYNKTLSIKIGEQNVNLAVSLQTGEEKRYNIKAPNGHYEVTVSDGTTEKIQTLPLTGRAISVSEPNGLDIFGSYPLIWVFIVAIIIALAAVFFLKYRKTRKFSSGSGFVPYVRNASREPRTIDIPRSAASIHSVRSAASQATPVHARPAERAEKVSNYAKPMSFFSKPTTAITSTASDKMIDMTRASQIHEAESSLVLKGSKSRATVLSIRVDIKSLGRNAREELGKMIESLKRHKAVIDQKDTHLNAIFSPMITKTFDNEIIASKAGMHLLRELNEYNRKFADKIDFNIGMHSGDLISSIEHGKLKYTSAGNTILLARKLADFDRGKFLISEEARKKIARELRASKVGEISNNSIFSVTGISDLEGNKSKLADLLKRTHFKQ